MTFSLPGWTAVYAMIRGNRGPYPVAMFVSRNDAVLWAADYYLSPTAFEIVPILTMSVELA